MSDPIVVVGAGQAGAQAVFSLRQLGYDGPLILVGDEPFAPYQRPPLSKAFLSGKLEAERLVLKPESAYAAANVELRLSTRVETLNAAANRLHLADGSVLPYASLLLATGSRARHVALPGCDLPGVVRLRTIRDVEAIRARLGPGVRFAIVGGGYIGLEVGAVARGMGAEVTVIEAAPRVMARVVAPLVSAYFAALHAGHGVAIRNGAGVRAIEGETDVTGVRLTDDTLLPADLVLLAVGGEPVTELAAAAGLRIDNGILVGADCRTSAPNVFAAGDCTRFHSALFRRDVRLESVQNAIDQAKAAAAAMLGQAARYDPVPWFWSDQYDVKLQIAGLTDPEAEIVVEGEPASGSFSASYVKDGMLLAVDAINAPRAHMLARRAVGRAFAGALNPAPNEGAERRRQRTPS